MTKILVYDETQPKPEPVVRLRLVLTDEGSAAVDVVSESGHRLQRLLTISENGLFRYAGATVDGLKFTESGRLLLLA